MNETDLQCLRDGEVEFGVFVSEHSEYTRRMVRHFAWSLTGVRAPIDGDDLVQLAHLALWDAVRKYEYRCPACPRAADSRAKFVRHVEARHGERMIPSPTLFAHVHSKVGRALDHEVRRYVRRRKWEGGEVMDIHDAEDRIEERVLFAQMVEVARKKLKPREQEVFRAMVEGRVRSPRQSEEVQGKLRRLA
jgi:hypothetical protein